MCAQPKRKSALTDYSAAIEKLGLQGKLFSHRDLLEAVLDNAMVGVKLPSRPGVWPRTAKTGGAA